MRAFLPDTPTVTQRISGLFLVLLLAGCGGESVAGISEASNEAPDASSTSVSTAPAEESEGDAAEKSANRSGT